jgi:hypothetical protein
MQHEVIIKVWSIAAICLLVATSGRSDGIEKHDAETVKAVFIERLCNFVEWPEEANLSDTSWPFVIGIMGRSPATSAIRRIYGSRPILGHPVEVRRIKTTSGIGGCHLLFIAENEKSRLADIIAAVSEEPVLTVSDTPGFCDWGVLLNFRIFNNKVGFEINERAVLDSPLSFSHHLLKTATIVEPVGDNK